MTNLIQNETQAAARDAELRRVYAVEWYGVHGALTVVERLLAEDFPTPDGATPTRYQVDALRALRSELAALVEGYERGG